MLASSRAMHHFMRLCFVGLVFSACDSDEGGKDATNPTETTSATTSDPDTSTPDDTTTPVETSDPTTEDTSVPEDTAGQCNALPNVAARFSRALEAAGGASCGEWALTIAPDGVTADRYRLARADRSGPNPLITTDTTVVLEGPIVATECQSGLLTQVTWSGSGTGPEPFLATSFEAEYSVTGSVSTVLISIVTHNFEGAEVTCEGNLTREPSQ